MSDKRAEQLELLRQVHSFPTRFLFKAIGPNTPEFMAEVLQTVIAITGKQSQPAIQSKESAKGQYLAVSVETDVASAELVLEVYAALQSIRGVRHLM